MSCSLIEHFNELPDPRVRGRTDYPLIEIVFLCISAIISGFDGWEAIEDFGHGKLDWLRKYLPYENGIPRHDTVARVMSCLSPKALQSCFVSWVQSIAKITEGEIVLLMVSKLVALMIGKIEKQRFIWSVHGPVKMAWF